MTLEKEFRITMRKRRNELGLTQKQLGDLIKMSQANISEVENGRFLPTVRTMDRIMTGLKLKMKIKVKDNE